MGLLFHTFGQGFILGIRLQESNFFESTSSDMNRLSLTGIDREEIRQSTRKQVRSRTPLTVGKTPHPNSSLSSYYIYLNHWLCICARSHTLARSLARPSPPTRPCFIVQLTITHFVSAPFVLYSSSSTRRQYHHLSLFSLENHIQNLKCYNNLSCVLLFFCLFWISKYKALL